MNWHHFLPSHYLWSLNCVVFAQACQTQSVWPAMLSMNHIVTQPSMLEGASKDAQSPSFTLSFFLSVQCFVLGYVIKDKSDYRVLLILLQGIKCFHVFQPQSLLHCRARSQWSVAFLRHLLFWMGMFKVFRWNGRKILIPKHMWKS